MSDSSATAAPAAAPASTEVKKDSGDKPRRRRQPTRGGARRHVDTPVSENTAYVGNLPYAVDEESMKMIFEGTKFVEVRVIRRARDNRSKGFGFVTFANSADRDEAVKLVNRTIVENRMIHVYPAHEMPPAEGEH